MHAHDLKREATEDNETDDDSARQSETRIITRRVQTVPWGRSGHTFLEQAIAESILVDGGHCIIQEIAINAAPATPGSFDLVEVAIDANGNLLSTKRARYAALVKNIPALKRRRVPTAL